MVTLRPSSPQPDPVPLRPTERIGMANLARASSSASRSSNEPACYVARGRGSASVIGEHMTAGRRGGTGRRPLLVLFGALFDKEALPDDEFPGQGVGVVVAHDGQDVVPRSGRGEGEAMDLTDYLRRLGGCPGGHEPQLPSWSGLSGERPLAEGKALFAHEAPTPAR